MNAPPVLSAPEDAAEVLRVGVAAAGGPVALACSFSIEDVVIVDLLREQDLPVSVFALDTGRLPEETYEVAEALRLRYGLAVTWYHPDAVAVERLLQGGPLSFRAGLAERHACCAVRKVAPLRRALTGCAAWITGQRRAHGLTRADLDAIERDEVHGLLKLNPLCHWSDQQVWAHADARALPRSRLYAQGYTSIGCAPCTRPVLPGEPARAGRWWWEAEEHKECGLHRRQP